jgi:hypothetical protein
MSRILGQLAVAIGGVFFILVMIVGTVRDVPMTTTLFRALIVMCVSSVAVAIFFRFFTKVLYRFAAEEVMRHRATKSARGPARPGTKQPELTERKAE